jgi:hypothetical protein
MHTLVSLALVLSATAHPPVASFHAVAVSSGFEAVVVRGPSSVKIEADEAVLKQIDTRVDAQGVLHLGMKPRSFERTGHVKVTISTPSLDAIEASGGSVIHGAFTPAKKCSIHASGGSTIALTALTCGELELEASGGSHFDAVGQARSIRAEASGGSTLSLRNIAAEKVLIDGSGGSEIRAFASAEIKGELSGGSELYLAGRPKARAVEASGGAEIFDIE